MLAATDGLIETNRRLDANRADIRGETFDEPKERDVGLGFSCELRDGEVRYIRRDAATDRHEVGFLDRGDRVKAHDWTNRARIEGVNAYQWVFCCKQVVAHAVAFSRGAQVVRDVLDGHRPQVWTSDRYSAQRSHADRQQTCLAHLARDARFADENSEDDAPFRLRLWFDRAFALARDIEPPPSQQCAPSAAH